MHPQRLSPAGHHNARVHAKTIYETIKTRLEPGLKGKIVAVEVESGEYFIGDTVLDAAGKGRAKHPDKVFHFFRIGFPSVYVSR